MSETCGSVVHFMNVACLAEGHSVKNCDTLKQWALLAYNIPFFVQVSSILASVIHSWNFRHKESVTELWACCMMSGLGFSCRVRIELLLLDETGRGDTGQQRSWDVVVHLKMEDLPHTIDHESWMTFTFKSMRCRLRTASADGGHTHS